MGTMPDALVIVMGGPREAFAAVHKYLEAKIPRIALVDTYYDEKTEALLAVEAIPDLAGIRLDTPASRRGNLPAIVREVRWELDLRGHKDVKIFVSGAVDEKSIPALLEAGVDGFGIGTSLSNAPTIDFALDLVEVDGKPAAKRGKFGGRKDLQRCPKDGTYEVGVRTCPVCGAKTAPAYTQYLDHGRVRAPLPVLDTIRERALRETERVFILRALASALEWSRRKRTSARRTIGSPNLSRPGDENFGPKSGRSSIPCLVARGSSMSEPAMDDTRRSSQNEATEPWPSTSPGDSC